MEKRLETEIYAETINELNAVVNMLESEGWICGKKEELEKYAFMVRFIKIYKF